MQPVDHDPLQFGLEDTQVTAGRAATASEHQQQSWRNLPRFLCVACVAIRRLVVLEVNLQQQAYHVGLTRCCIVLQGQQHHCIQPHCLAHTCSYMQTSQADDLPAAYGASSTAEPLGNAAGASAPPLPQPHDPLAPSTANSDPPQHSTWQHYPDPGPAAATSTPASAGLHSEPTQPEQHQDGSAAGNGLYPAVPTPANYPISLGSVGSGSLSGSAQGTPHAGAAVLGGLATALSALPSSNPELRISVGKPLRHMGPSGIPGVCVWGGGTCGGVTL